MARGQKTLWDELMTSEVKTRLADEKQRPRNVLMPERNHLMLYRFYYHAEINRMRYDDILTQLEKEFFIVESRLIVILTSNRERIAQITKEEKPTREYLEKQYPHINWKHNPR